MFVGQKVSIRFINKADVETIVRYFNSEEARRWGLIFRDPAVVAQCTEKLPHQREEGYFVILDRQSNKIIGALYYHIKLKHLQALWAGVVNKEFRRNGVLTESWYLLGKFLFDTFPIHKVESHVLGDNEISLSWCKKSGLEVEGRIRETWFCNGKLHDLVYVGIMRDSFYDRYKDFFALKQDLPMLSIMSIA